MTDTTYDTLLQDYIRICNTALEANQHCYPYMRVLTEIEDRLRARPMRGAVYREDDTQPEAFFELILEDKRISVKMRDKHSACSPWLISRHYLEQVTQHSDEYITNPAELDWRWLNDHSLG